MTTSAEVVVEIDVQRRFASLTINRPHRKNALLTETMQDISDAISRLGEDTEVNTVILTGKDGFCSGIDLERLGATSSEEVEQTGESIYDIPQGMIRALLALPIPTIAAVDGPALGLGMDLALACDTCLIGKEGWLMQGWGRVGLVPGTGGVLLMDRLPTRSLWKMLATQPRLDGPAAESEGLAEAIDGNALEAAQERSATFGGFSRRMLEAYVALFRSPTRVALDDHLKMAAKLQLGLFADGEFRDRARSVQEGRNSS